MDAQITITLPEPLYKRARTLARTSQRSLDSIIADALDRELSTIPAESEMDDSPFAVEEDVDHSLALETAAYEQMHDRLMARFAGEYVAVFKGQLIDHDTDSSALLNRIDVAYPNDVVLVKRVVPLPEPEIRVRSPRLERP